MFLGKIKLNILSFKDAELELRPLNVLIGANAAGKSNLIRVFGLLRALPTDVSAELALGGGAKAWINQRTDGPAGVTLSQLAGIGPSYKLVFQAIAQSYEIEEEYAPLIFHRAGDRIKFDASSLRDYRKLKLDEAAETVLSRQQSVLQQWRIPGKLIGKLASQLNSIRLYREFKTGPGTSARYGINASVLAESLSEDGSNLALVLNELNLHQGLNQVNEVLHRFCDSLPRWSC